MSKPVRLQLSRRKGFRLTSPNGLRIVSCSRPGPLGNVFTGPGAVEAWSRYLSGESGQIFECGPGKLSMAFIPPWHHPEDVRKLLAKARGLNMACWCKLCPKHEKSGKPFDEECSDCKPCHVDVNLRIANTSEAQ